jgi:hypothetical protein
MTAGAPFNKSFSRKFAGSRRSTPDCCVYRETGATFSLSLWAHAKGQRSAGRFGALETRNNKIRVADHGGHWGLGRWRRFETTSTMGQDNKEEMLTVFAARAVQDRS